MQRRAEARAAALGLTFADCVATLIADDVDDAQRSVIASKGGEAAFDISEMFDLGSSDEPTDIARDKDRLVGEAASSEHQPRPDSRRQDYGGICRYVGVVRGRQCT